MKKYIIKYFGTVERFEKYYNDNPVELIKWEMAYTKYDTSGYFIVAQFEREAAQ